MPTGEGGPDDAQSVRRAPQYPITSVDHALQLLLLLQREGTLGVRDAAATLQVSPSTAHRLLAMLVHRGFAEQGPDRRYHLGPVLQRTPHAAAAVTTLRQVARPHLDALVREVDESANLTVLASTAVHFILSLQADRALRTGDRTGASLPAHRTSGGKVLLAALPVEELIAIYSGVAGVDLDELLAELARVREQGFALNDQQTETGLVAVGVLVEPVGGVAAAAVSLALPSARYDPGKLASWVSALRRTGRAISRDLARSRRPTR